MRVLTSIFFLAVTILAGCGQKGPLYIEQDKGASTSTSIAADSKNTNNTQDDTNPIE